MDAMDDHMLFNILSNLHNKWLFRCLPVNKQFHRITLSIMRPRWFKFDCNKYSKSVHFCICPPNSLCTHTPPLEYSLEYISKLFDGIIYKHAMNAFSNRFYSSLVPYEHLSILSKFRFIKFKDLNIMDYMMRYFCDAEILKIPHAIIGSDGIKNLKKCVVLDISYSEVDNSGLKYLASLNSLKYLKANYCPYITSEALSYFPPNVKIEMRKAVPPFFW